MSTTVSVHVIISGRVQGVWFRAWTQKTAQGLGLTGWVRNRSDATVEAVFCGPEEVVTKMVALCHKGPVLARVSGVEQTPSASPNLSGFELRPTC